MTVMCHECILATKRTVKQGPNVVLEEFYCRLTGEKVVSNHSCNQGRKSK